jgi:hypothetical protein
MLAVTDAAASGASWTMTEPGTKWLVPLSKMFSESPSEPFVAPCRSRAADRRRRG